MTAPAQLVLPTPLAEAHTGWPFITAISVTGHSHCTEAVGFHPGGSRTFRWYLRWGYSELMGLDQENIDWCRGWHEKDSPEVKAMLVARGLA